MSTDLQQRVWYTLTKIPKGCVTTYGLIAKHLNTKAVRAVASAIGKNPNAPKVPCHRVILSDGSIGKYSGVGGVKGKIKLLKAEGVKTKNSKIQNFNTVLFDFS